MEDSINLRKFICRNSLVVIGICFVLLICFYVVSHSFYLSYEKAKTEMETARENLKPTDLSELAVIGYRLGDMLGSIPEDFEGQFTCEDGGSYSVRNQPDLCESVVSGIVTGSFYYVEYNGVIVENGVKLIELLGENFICVELEYWYRRDNVKIFLDKEQNIELHMGSPGTYIDGYRLELQRLRTIGNDYSSFHHYDRYFTNPIGGVWSILNRTSYKYFDSFYVARRGDFTQSELFFIPIYFTALLLPLVILVVYRNEKALRVFFYAIGAYVLMALLASLFATMH